MMQLATHYNASAVAHQNIEFPNGDIYDGQVKGKLKHGTGLYRYHNGDSYDG